MLLMLAMLAMFGKPNIPIGLIGPPLNICIAMFAIGFGGPNMPMPMVLGVLVQKDVDNSNVVNEVDSLNVVNEVAVNKDLK